MKRAITIVIRERMTKIIMMKAKNKENITTINKNYNDNNKYTITTANTTTREKVTIIIMKLML